jgi:hypothetical protein
MYDLIMRDPKPTISPVASFEDIVFEIIDRAKRDGKCDAMSIFHLCIHEFGADKIQESISDIILGLDDYIDEPLNFSFLTRLHIMSPTLLK